MVRVNFAWCPAEMKVVKDGGPNGKVMVEWNSSHYGHDLDHLTLVAMQDGENLEQNQNGDVVEMADLSEEQHTEEVILFLLFFIL